MKNIYKFLSLITIAALCISCSDDNDKMGLGEIDNIEQAQTKSFAENDGATNLTKRSAGFKANKLLTVAGPSVGETLGYVNITDAQYAEIKAYADKLVADAGCTTDEEKHKVLFDWVYGNIKYEWSDNDPYPVFKNRKGICQGYANLLKVMLHSQGIPCVITNGMLQPFGGHAWLYVYYNSRWYVSDPTNNYYYIGTMYTSNSQYEPTSLDAVLFEDEYCTYDYYEGALNVRSIKPGQEVVSIPFSAGGLMISKVSPTVPVPSTVKEIYIGANINSLGDSYVGLSNLAPSLAGIYVDPSNTTLESFSNVVYNKSESGYTMCFVAPAVRYIELKAIESFDKESLLKNLPNLEQITFVPGTKNIGVWTVENCPSLQVAYVPNETTVANGAFSGVSKYFVMIRGNYTNIPQIKY